MKDFLDVLTELQNTPLPLMFIGGGILFLFIAVGGQIGGKISTSAIGVKHGYAAALGVALLLSGVVLYIIPIVVSPFPTPTTHPPKDTPAESTEPTLPDTPAISSMSIPRITPTLILSSPIPVSVGSLRQKDQAMMVYVQEGTFNMGSSDEQVKDAIDSCEQVRKNLTSDQQGGYLCEFEDESPLHRVRLSAFWMDKTEITNNQFAMFLNAGNNYISKGEIWLDIGSKDSLIELKDGHFQPKSGYEKYPVVMVSWYGARAYCNWVGGRLPTEAEWEYAARGTTNSIYPWGNDFNGDWLNFCDRNCTSGWRDTKYDDGYRYASPVGSFAEGRSWSGALDMAGNVWEWNNDLYGENYYDYSPSQNPLGPEVGQAKVVRGGGWDASRRETRTARRGVYRPDRYLSYIGFRCVIEAGG